MSEQTGELISAVSRKLRCPCGVPADTDPRFHKRAAFHDCQHHPRRVCPVCKGVDRLIAGVEARLWVEVEHGPFEVA